MATSGIGRRRWIGPDSRLSHHLLDPSTGRPAFTGLVQVTALAPTALEAEALAKAALLAGPDFLAQRLPHGGVALLDDGQAVGRPWAGRGPVISVLAETQFFWYSSRAAGTAAMVLASLSVAYGLLAAGRLLPKRFAASRVVHEALSLATIVLIAYHGVMLVFDSFIDFSLADILVPFVSGYKPVWQAMGIIGGWALVILGLSYYARARIGINRWRSLHRLTGIAWVLSLGHSLGEGTDAGKRWFLALLALLAAPIIPAAIALGLRLRGRNASARRPVVQPR